MYRMICKPCRNKNHHNCKGGSWCDCAHLDSGVNWSLVKKPGAQVTDPTTRPVDC